MRAAFHAFRVAVSITGILAFASGPARADVTKGQCVDANGRGQQLRAEIKLSAAREEFRTCASPSCPAIVRDDCAQRLDELDRVQPTIVFEVKNAAGSDVGAVKVTVDGKPLTERLDGTALPVDIGEHIFGFEVSDQPPVMRTLIVAEGEKLRRERIVLGAAGTRAVAPPPSPPSASSNEANAPSGSGVGSSTSAPVAAGGGKRTQKILGLVAGGAGIAVAAVGTVFAGIASSQWSTALSACPGYAGCSPPAVSERNDAARSANVSTVSFIAGGVLLATGVTLFLTAPKDNPARIGLTVAPAGIGLVGRL